MRIIALLLALVAGIFALFAGDLLDRELMAPFMAAWPAGDTWRSAALAVWYGLPAAAIFAGLLALLAPGIAAALLLVVAAGWGVMGLLLPAFAVPELAIAPGAALIASVLALIAGEWQVRRTRTMRRRLREGRIAEDVEDDPEPASARYMGAADEVSAREQALNAEPALLSRERRVSPSLASLAAAERRSDPIRPARLPPDWAVPPKRDREPEMPTEFDPFTRRAPRQVEHEPLISREPDPEAEPEPAPELQPEADSFARVERRAEPRLGSMRAAPAAEMEDFAMAPETRRRGIGLGAALLLSLNLLVVAGLAGVAGYLYATSGQAPAAPVAALTLPAAPSGATAPEPAATAEASWDNPFAYCEAVGTIDAPDQRYAGPPVPTTISAGVRAPAAASADRVKWRCVDGRVMGCKSYQWPVCDKVPTTAELVAYCTQNPNVPRLLAPAGTWSCENGQPRLPAGISWARDARGFEAAGWSIIPRPAGSS
jgi:hypothetical protein